MCCFSVRVHILLPGLQVILDVLLEITQLYILVEQSAGALEVISLWDITRPLQSNLFLEAHQPIPIA